MSRHNERLINVQPIGRVNRKAFSAELNAEGFYVRLPRQDPMRRLATKNCRVGAFGSDNCLEGFSMNDLAELAERLRAIRAREDDFLGRFAAESLFDRPIFLDGVLDDLGEAATPARERLESRFGRQHPER